MSGYCRSDTLVRGMTHSLRLSPEMHVEAISCRVECLGVDGGRIGLLGHEHMGAWSKLNSGHPPDMLPP